MTWGVVDRTGAGGSAIPSALEAELRRILDDAAVAVGWFPEIEFVASEFVASEFLTSGTGSALSVLPDVVVADHAASPEQLDQLERAAESEPTADHEPVHEPPAVNEPTVVQEPAGDQLLVLLESTLAVLASAAPASTPEVSIDRIAALEALISAAGGLRAAEEVAFADGQRAAHLAAKVRSRDVGRGTAEQIGFARRISPNSAARQLGFAQALVARLPQTFQELRAGRISEIQARIAVTRSSHLSETDAALVDAAIAPRLQGWSSSATEKAVDHIAYSLDPRGSVDRKASAEQDRRVWVRPAPDSMAIVSALLPMAQGVGVFAGLRTAALALHGTSESEGRGIGQLMADLLVERCTGQATADAVPVEIRVTLPVDSVLGDGAAPGWVDNYGPVPAAVVRELVGCGGEPHERTLRPEHASQGDPPHDEPPRGSGTHHGRAAPSANDGSTATPTSSAAEKCCCTGVPDARVRIRRLFTDPVDGSVVDVDARSRLFPESMRRHIMIRDRQCRQPYCDAPIRDADHVTPYARGGPTTLVNGQGLCLRGNQMKEMPGWSTRRQGDGSTLVVTPTGHRYVRERQSATGLPALTRRE
ncbi:DUF222 domain-containing protein [Nakamurella sp. A5-74]|uniref:DUF222 domain-containing protein n=1 Tax=Nakamurella sp. A5-74 TaxID=3158264 RepID=A0AAU8DT69_9ACTN